MNEKELKNAWTRLLDGQQLSADEIDGLDSVRSDSETNDWITNDLLVDDLLNSAAIEESDSDSDRFVEQFRSNVERAKTITPPPIQIVPPPVIANSAPVSKPGSAYRNKPKSSNRVFIVLGAIAATAAMLLIGLAILSANRDGQIATEKPGRKRLGDVKPKPVQPEIETFTNRIPELADKDSLRPREKIEQPDGFPKHTPSPKTEIDRGPETPLVDSPAKKETPVPQEQVEPALAVLMSSSDAVWRKTFDPNKRLIAEKIPLESGTAKLRMASGTEIVFAGPIELELLGPNKVSVTKGKLAANVPREAIGFEVRTPSSRIIDLGTRFNVDVDSQSATNVAVAEGKVEVVRDDPRRKGKEITTQLTAGQSQWISSDGKQAFDWRMIVQFGDKDAAPNELKIDGEVFDVSRPDQAVFAMKKVSSRLADAKRQLTDRDRGERFSGVVIVNGKSHKVASSKQIANMRIELMRQVQQRWSGEMFRNTFSPEMQDFFEGKSFQFFEGGIK